MQCLLLLGAIAANLAQSMLKLTNSYRAAKNQESLKSVNSLVEVAMEQARHMCSTGKLTHESPDGSLMNRLKAKGFHGVKIGENIAKHGSGEDDEYKEVAHTWMNSDPHKENILGDFTYTGIGTCKDKNNNRYWIQVFGKNVSNDSIDNISSLDSLVNSGYSGLENDRVIIILKPDQSPNSGNILKDFKPIKGNPMKNFKCLENCISTASESSYTFSKSAHDDIKSTQSVDQSQEVCMKYGLCSNVASSYSVPVSTTVSTVFITTTVSQSASIPSSICASQSVSQSTSIPNITSSASTVNPSVDVSIMKYFEKIKNEILKELKDNKNSPKDSDSSSKDNKQPLKDDTLPFGDSKRFPKDEKLPLINSQNDKTKEDPNNKDTTNENNSSNYESNKDDDISKLDPKKDSDSSKLDPKKDGNCSTKEEKTCNDPSSDPLSSRDHFNSSKKGKRMPDSSKNESKGDESLQKLLEKLMRNSTGSEKDKNLLMKMLKKLLNGEVNQQKKPFVEISTPLST